VTCRYFKDRGSFAFVSSPVHDIPGNGDEALAIELDIGDSSVMLVRSRPAAIKSGIFDWARYDGPVVLRAETSVTDHRSGRAVFSGLPRLATDETPPPATPASVSGSIEWSCEPVGP
jgi:hypothetical protein